MACALTLPLCAQTEYNLHRIDINSGLVGNYAAALLQDSEGFMWIGTNNGLQRFDMNTFVNFLPHEMVSSLLKDRQDRWWVCGNAVNKFDAKRRSFERVPLLIDNEEKYFISSSHIFEDSKNRIWLRTELVGVPRKTWLLLFNEKNSRFEEVNDRLLTDLDGIIGVVEMSNGNFWAYSSSGVYHVNETKGRLSSFNYNPDSIPFLRMVEFSKPIHAMWAKGDNLFITTWPTQFYWIDKNLNLKYSFYVDSEVRDVLYDREGTIWLAGESLLRINPEKGIKEFIKLPDDIKMINRITQDHEGNIWLATYRGVVIIDPDSRVVKRLNHSIDGRSSTNETMGMLKMTDGTIVISTWQGGIFYYDDKLRPVKGLKLNAGDSTIISNCPLWVFKEDSKKNLWMGGQDGQVFILNTKSGQLRSFYDSTFRRQTIRSIDEDSFGNVWLGTQKGRIVKWEKRNARFMTVYTPTKQSYTVTCLRSDRQYMWATVGTDLLRIDVRTNRVTRFQQTHGSSSNENYILFGGIVRLSDSEIILSSMLGLGRFDKKTEKFELFARTPSGISSTERIDDSQYIMALVNGSIVKYDNGALIYLDKGAVYTATNASLQLSDGRIVFAEEGGLTVVKPETPRGQIVTPAKITSVKVRDTELNVDSVLLNGLELAYDENYITMNFSAFLFRARDNVNYHYRINKEGEFVNAGTELSVTYAQLSPGAYRFELFYTLPNGVKSDITSFSISVAPPFWKRTWFIVAVNALALSAIYFVYHLRQTRSRALSKVRERISRDLHDEMGSNVSTINILTKVARSELSKPQVTKAAEMLEKIGDISSEVMESMDQIVWSLNQQDDSLEQLVARMRLLGARLLEDHNINFIFDVEGDPKAFELNMEGRNELYLIYKESINNILKYAMCKNVFVNLSIHKSNLKFVIADDGVGFNPTNRRRGNGLQNMKVRSDNLRAKLTISSEPNKGTRVELDISPNYTSKLF
jgi:ligand-binding sensor domain-containing protein/two-component sensor histidine kinase